jgi:hypothetical protein
LAALLSGSELAAFAGGVSTALVESPSVAILVEV